MKTVEIFKTNIQNDKVADKITISLLALYPVYKINFDLEDEENILRIEANKFKIETEEIIDYMIGLGYSCEPIK
ncbi:hypothetical protein [Myroides injenensis]|uniref:hypothetical protein n=1 Tax=Myroides injenensis TaxID=1183151 RepID=UPI0002891C59|nr:hypothetical protein [Myroides injenensis]